MNEIYGYILAFVAILTGGVLAFLKGRSSGADRKQQELEQHEAKEQAATIEVREEVRKAIAESKEQTNAQTRDDLIDSLAGDSVRKPKD